MKPEFFRLEVTRKDDSKVVMAFVTKDFYRDGTVNFHRLATKENVDAAIAELEKSWVRTDPDTVPVKGWRFIDGP